MSLIGYDCSASSILEGGVDCSASSILEGGVSREELRCLRRGARSMFGCRAVRRWGQRIRMEMTSWLRAPLNCFSDATTERIVLMSSAQVGKTLSALCMTMWSVCEQRGNLLFCQHTEAAAKDFAQLRMNPILNECADAYLWEGRKEHSWAYEKRI